VGIIGGNFYCIEDDALYSETTTATLSTVNPPCTAGQPVPHTIDQPSLASQLEAAHLSWKSYQQSLPYPGFTGEYYPSKNDTLYVSKHDPFLNFKSVQQSPTELQNIVPDTALDTDLESCVSRTTCGQVPNFGFISPDECHDMHGGMTQCPGSSQPLDSNDLKLISAGDAYAASKVSEIMQSYVWSHTNSAIVITFDEYDDADPTPQPTTSCCDAPIPGAINGGRVATIVITSQGPRGENDPTPYNHYSLLQTIQDAFGLKCLQFTCKTAVTPMARLFATS
jgi:phospholipase C